MILSPLPIQKFFANNGRPLVGGKLFTYTAGTTTKIATYSNQSGTLNTNPITLDFRGEANVWLDPTLTYKFVLAPANDTDPPTNPIWTVDNIAGGLTINELTQQFLGGILWPRTAAEIAASVTPTYYYYPPGDIRRYGAVLDGATDDRAAITSAYAQFKQTGGADIILPAGTSYVSKNGTNVYALLFDNDVILEGYGNFTLKGDGVNDYTLIYALGGTGITVDVRGINFDCGKASPNRPADNNDICFRIESSIDTINIQDCNFGNYDNDGVYFRATVTGAGGRIHHNRFRNGARSAVTLVKGQYISIENNDISGMLLSPLTVQAVDINTVCRQISVDFNRIIGGGTDTNSASDRCAIFIAHVAGAASSVMGQYTCRGNVIKDFGVGYAGAAFAFGIEIRECTDILIEGNEVTGCKSAGLYSYLTIRAAFIGNLSCTNDKGLWMNKCTDYSEEANVCFNNVTKDRDYHGPDGATTYLWADGLTEIIARGSVSFSAGTPSLNSSFGVTSLTDLGVGDTQINLDRTAGTANYSAIVTFRSFSGTAGVIMTASHTTTTFRVVSFTAGVAADENFDFVVVGIPNNTTEPP